jgi:hypothetical protein
MTLRNMTVILTAVMTSTVLWDVTPNRPRKDVYCLHLQGQRISQAAKKTVPFWNYGVGVGAASSAVIRDTQAARRVCLLTSKMLASCEISRAYTPPDAPITYSSGSSMEVPRDPVTRKHCSHTLGEKNGPDVCQGSNPTFV